MRGWACSKLCRSHGERAHDNGDDLCGRSTVGVRSGLSATQLRSHNRTYVKGVEGMGKVSWNFVGDDGAT
jgi:hypothetical protein